MYHPAGSPRLVIFNPTMMILAREAAGFTQAELAGLLAWSQSKISKVEDGLLCPSEMDIPQLGKALNRKPEFFSVAGRLASSSVSFYRKTNSLPVKLLKQCNAQMNLERLQVTAKLGGKPRAELNIPYLPTEQGNTPVSAAKQVRKLWNQPAGPITNVTRLAELAGCVVVHFPFQTAKLDGLCLWSEGEIPFIFLNESFPAARLRLSLAHELGHLVLHRAPHDRVEEEAWAFAAELLMPEQSIKKDLSYPLTLEKLAQKKLVWKVSMQALLKRAESVGQVTPRYARYLWMQMGKCGYRLNEPYDDRMEKERPSAIN